MESVLVPLIVFTCIFGIAYVFLTTRNKERIALIENGVDAKLFNSGRNFSLGEFTLNLSLLAVGIGTGVLIGAVLAQGGIQESVAFTSSIFIFGGIGLGASFFLNRKLEQKIN